MENEAKLESLINWSVVGSVKTAWYLRFEEDAAGMKSVWVCERKMSLRTGEPIYFNLHEQDCVCDICRKVKENPAWDRWYTDPYKPVGELNPPGYVVPYPIDRQDNTQAGAEGTVQLATAQGTVN